MPNAKFIDAYRALEGVFPEADSIGNGQGDTPPTKDAVKLKVAAARQAKARGAYLERTARGGDLTSAVLTDVRQLIKQGHKAQVVAMGHAMRTRTESRDIGAAVLGTAVLHMSGPNNAWPLFAEIANTAASEGAANELYAAAFGVLGQEAARILDDDIAASRTTSWDPGTLLRVAQKALARGLNDQSRELIRQAAERPAASMSTIIREEFARLSTWLPDGSHRAAIPLGRGDVNFGILGYEQPDITSRNIGDYIQTIASMGHLARQTNITFDGDPELVDFANELRAGSKPERAVEGPSATFNLFELNRDGNPLQDLPEKTWALNFGWHMHHMFGQGYGLPFHPNLRPILISVFIRFPDMLTPEAVEYLKKYAPVGCRDWQSVALLRAVGVPAFFSGCMTTTIDTVFHREGPDNRDATIYVDSPQTGPGESRTQVQTGIRALGFAENLRLAREWVSHYHLTYNKVVTSRLHCNLPARSVGSQVTFLPKNRSDNRFGGLIDASDSAFEAIRQGILDKSSQMIMAIAAGTPEDEVYQLWRKICAPAMAEADEYLASATLPALTDEASHDVLQVTNAYTGGKERGDVINVVIDARRGEGRYLVPLLRSMLDKTGSHLKLWITADMVTAMERRVVEDLGLPVEIAWLDVRKSGSSSFGTADPKQAHELLLALTMDALPDVDHVVFLPASALLRGDIAELSGQAPSNGNFVTARDDQHRGRAGGLEMFRRVASRQGDDNEKALNLIFATHRPSAGDFIAFDPNVMVIDVRALRRAGLTLRLPAIVREYTMTFREAINTVAGFQRQKLPAAWSHTPGYEEQDNPKLVNWRDTSKPWGELHTPFGDEFMAHSV